MSPSLIIEDSVTTLNIQIKIFQLDCDEVAIKAFKVPNLINKVAETYPDFSSNKIDEDSIIVSNWGSKKYFRGSYTYQKPGTDGRDIKNLAEPVTYGDTHLLFAGEATDKHHFSTVHGAYMSGIREVENIKNIYQLNIVDQF